ncbi:MAG: hypothetical protein QXF08_01265, partial [Nitrososphaerota archaeon]
MWREKIVCPHCGKLTERGLFCKFCGKSLEVKSETPITEKTTPPTLPSEEALPPTPQEIVPPIQEVAEERKIVEQLST